MAKVVPAHEVGLPEGAGRVRVSSSRARRGKILAVEHPVFGWVRYREWALLGYLEGLVERVGPLELVAWVGLTYTFSVTITKSGEFLSWIQNTAVGASDFFTGIVAAITGIDIPLLAPAVELPDILGGVVGQATKYFWAAVAAAMTILAVKRV